MIVWCTECKTNDIRDEWFLCRSCWDARQPRAFIDMTLAQQEDIIPERCAGYFSPEAIAERWPTAAEVRTYSFGATYTLGEFFAGYEALWASRTPRVEWNTVNLKELREEWQSRRWAMSSEGWQRLKDRQKYVF